MALALTPDGRQVPVPDGIGFDPPPMPQQVSTTEYGLVPANLPGLLSGGAQPPAPPPQPAPTPLGAPGSIAALANANHSTSSVLPLLHIGAGQGTGAIGDEVAAPDPNAGTPASVTGGALQTGMPGVTPQAQPDYTIGSATPLTPKTLAASNKAYDAKQAAAAAYAASPQGALTAAGAKQGDADAMAANAIGSELATSQSKAADNQAAYTEYGNRLAQLDKDQKAFQADYAKTRAQKQAYVDASLKDVDNFKVDPGKDFKGATGIGWLVAAALSGIGEQILHPNGNAGENPVIKMMQEKMQQSIRLQMDERDQLKDKNSRAEHALDKYDAFSQSREAQFEAQSAKADRWLAQQITMTAAKYQSADATTRAQAATANLLQSSADHAQKAAEFATNNDMAGKQLALTKRGQDLSAWNESANRAQQKAFHTDDVAFRVQSHADEMAEKDKEIDAKAAAARAAGHDAEAKQLEGIRKYGLRDPSTGDLILDQKGEALKAQADQLEVAANQSQGPQAAALKAKAVQIREQADRENHIEHDKAPEVQDALNSAQNVVDTTAAIKAQLAKDPGMTDRATWAKLSTQFANAKANAVTFFKAKPSSREMEAFEEFMGPDGSKLFDRSFSKDKMAAALDSLSSTITSDADTTLRGAGYKGSFHIQAHQGEVIPEVQGKTGTEAGEDAKRGSVGAQLPDADLKFRTNDARQLSAENNADTGPSGLSKQDDTAVSRMVSRYNSAPDAERAKILTQLTAYASSPRESVANGVATIMRDNPALYQQVLSVLPPDRQEQFKLFDANKPQLKKGVMLKTADGRQVWVPAEVAGQGQ